MNEEIMEKEKRFIDNGDGTVTDTSTGLIWQQQTTERMTWEEAISYCEKMELVGEGWRLPTVKDLHSLVDYTRYNPSIDTNAFPDTKSSCYWSSTTGTSGTRHAWCVYFSSGGVAYGYKSSSYYVRAVRGGHSN